jgi:hypothetical protein
MSLLSQQLQRQSSNTETAPLPPSTATATAPTAHNLPPPLNLHTQRTAATSTITVYGAASGIVVDLQLSSTDSVKTLQEQIALSLHVEPSNQILLLTNRDNHASSGSSWIQSPSALLKTYNLPSLDRVVYLFDRRLLSRRSSTPESVTITAHTNPVPQDSSTLETLINAHRMAEDAAGTPSDEGGSTPGGGGITSPRRPSLSSSGRSSVTFASLQATLLQFELHLRQVKTCAANGTQRFQTYLASVERQQVSLTALDVATQNLKDLMAS